MRVTVNGEVWRADTDKTLEDLIQGSGAESSRVAVLLNDRVVPAAERPGTALKDGDAVEILVLSGGG